MKIKYCPEKTTYLEHSIKTSRMLEKLQNFKIRQRIVATIFEDFIEVCIALVADFWFGFVAM